MTPEGKKEIRKCYCPNCRNEVDVVKQRGSLGLFVCTCGRILTKIRRVPNSYDGRIVHLNENRFEAPKGEDHDTK